MRPVVPAAGQDADTLRFDMYGQPVAVQLHFIQIPVTAGRLRTELREAGLDSLRHRVERQLRLLGIAGLSRAAPDWRVVG